MSRISGSCLTIFGSYDAVAAVNDIVVCRKTYMYLPVGQRMLVAIRSCKYSVFYIWGSAVGLYIHVVLRQAPGIGRLYLYFTMLL